MNKPISLLQSALGIVFVAAAVAGCTPEKKTLLVSSEGQSYGSDEKTEYTYDEEGYLIEEVNVSHSEDYTSDIRTKYEYNDKHQKVLELMTYDGMNSIKKEWKYNENGDTLACLTFNWEEGAWEVVRKFVYAYSEDGKLQHKYEFNYMLPEDYSDVTDILADHVYDAEGREVSTKLYNLDWSQDVYKIDLSDNIDSPAEEMKGYVAEYDMKRGEAAFTYNAGGKMLTSHRKDGNGSVTDVTYSYDADGRLTKEINNTLYDGGTSYCNNTVYTYDADSRMVSSLMTTEGEDYNVATELKYNENGDTLEVIELTTVDANTNVSQKYRYVYDENGKLREKYLYATEDVIGYEYLNIGVEKYDANGNEVEWMTYTSDDYENYKVAKSFSGSAEEEFNDMIARFKMTCGMHLIYKYKEIEVASSLIDRIKAFFNFS